MHVPVLVSWWWLRLGAGWGFRWGLWLGRGFRSRLSLRCGLRWRLQCRHSLFRAFNDPLCIAQTPRVHVRGDILSDEWPVKGRRWRTTADWPPGDVWSRRVQWGTAACHAGTRGVVTTDTDVEDSRNGTAGWLRAIGWNPLSLSIVTVRCSKGVNYNCHILKVCVNYDCQILKGCQRWPRWSKGVSYDC